MSLQAANGIENVQTLQRKMWASKPFSCPVRVNSVRCKPMVTGALVFGSNKWNQQKAGHCHMTVNDTGMRCFNWQTQIILSFMNLFVFVWPWLSCFKMQALLSWRIKQHHIICQVYCHLCLAMHGWSAVHCCATSWLGGSDESWQATLIEDSSSLLESNWWLENDSTDSDWRLESDDLWTMWETPSSSPSLPGVLSRWLGLYNSCWLVASFIETWF